MFIILTQYQAYYNAKNKKKVIYCVKNTQKVWKFKIFFVLLQRKKYAINEKRYDFKN